MVKEEFAAVVGPTPKEVEQFIAEALRPSTEAILAYAKKYPAHLDVRDESLDSKPTVLMLVSAAGHEKAAKLMLHLGADEKLRDANGRDARAYADMNNQSAVVSMYDGLEAKPILRLTALKFMN